MQNSSPNRITVVIPHRMSEDASITLASLSNQSFKAFKVVVVPDEGKGACWARNEGFQHCDTEFVLFSDNDIYWQENALETMVDCLDRRTNASYCYGRYQIGDLIVGHVLFSPPALLKNNYISTMSLLRAKDFPGFDESIKRFQDWDLWLTLLKQGKRGVYCNELIFKTDEKDGISKNGQSLDEAISVINQKHNLGISEYARDFIKQ